MAGPRCYRTLLALALAAVAVAVQSASIIKENLLTLPLAGSEMGERIVVLRKSESGSTASDSTSSSGVESEDSSRDADSSDDLSSDEAIDMGSPVSFPPTGTCIPPLVPGQTCRLVNVLGIMEPGGTTSTSGFYSQAFSLGAFDPNIIDNSVEILLDEANGDRPLNCAREFVEVSPTVLRAIQSVGTAVVDYIFIFPRAVATGQRRVLNGTRVLFTLPNLGTFGDLQLGFNYNTIGTVESVEHFIRPPAQATDQFFRFPILQEVDAFKISVWHYCHWRTTVAVTNTISLVTM